MPNLIEVPCHRYADLSTMHLSLIDRRMLEVGKFPCQFVAIEPGGICYVQRPDEATARLDPECVVEFEKKASEAALSIFQELARQKIPYVRFDRDAEVVPGLITFDDDGKMSIPRTHACVEFYAEVGLFDGQKARVRFNSVQALAAGILKHTMCYDQITRLAWIGGLGPAYSYRMYSPHVVNLAEILTLGGMDPYEEVEAHLHKLNLGNE